MDMAEAEQPDRLARRATIGDIRQLTVGSTPHFALQLRARIARLIAPLPHDDPVQVYGASPRRTAAPRFATTPVARASVGAPMSVGIPPCARTQFPYYGSWQPTTIKRRDHVDT
jgi:hypothetical protein